MNRIKYIALLTGTCVFLFGCKKTTDATISEPVQNTETNNVEYSGEISAAKAVVEEDKVTVAIPAEYFPADITQADFDNMVAEDPGILSITVDKDGVVTYVMTKSAHEAKVREVENTIVESLDEIAKSDEYPSIIGINSTESFSNYMVKTNIKSESELTEEDYMAIYTLFIFADMYNSYAGTENIEPVVKLFNVDNEFIREYHVGDLSQ